MDSALEEFLIPGSLWFLFLGLSVGVLLLYWRGGAERWGRRWLTALVGLYWLLSIPVVPKWLEARLIGGYTSLANHRQAATAKAVVVLTGGAMTFRTEGRSITSLSSATAFRLLEAIRVYGLLDQPWLIVCGATRDRRGQSGLYEAIRDELIKAGVPAERIVLESTSRNTREQAMNLAPLLQGHRVEQFVLVTSPTHMRRAMGTFEANHLHPVASVSAGAAEEMIASRWLFLPGSDSLRATRWALREYLALAYYWSRGWTTRG